MCTLANVIYTSKWLLLHILWYDIVSWTILFLLPYLGKHAFMLCILIQFNVMFGGVAVGEETGEECSVISFCHNVHIVNTYLDIYH